MAGPMINCKACSGIGKTSASVDCLRCEGRGWIPSDPRNPLFPFPEPQTQDGNPPTEPTEADQEAIAERFRGAVDELQQRRQYAEAISTHVGWAGGYPNLPLTEDDVEARYGDAVHHPAHYKQVPGIECIEVTQHFNFCLGNVIKYVWRADEKGRAIEDLEKAAWYLAHEIAIRKAVQP